MRTSDSPRELCILFCNGIARLDHHYSEATALQVHHAGQRVDYKVLVKDFRETWKLMLEIAEVLQVRHGAGDTAKNMGAVLEHYKHVLSKLSRRLHEFKRPTTSNRHSSLGVQSAFNNSSVTDGLDGSDCQSTNGQYKLQ